MKNKNPLNACLSIKYALFITLHLSLITQSKAQSRFEFSPLARAAYDKTLALKFEEANGLIAELRRKEPSNAVAY
jgi:hypothetical protein